MIKYCPVCARQVVVGDSLSNEFIAPGIHPKYGFSDDELFCDECGKYLDENGNFPEEE